MTMYCLIDVNNMMHRVRNIIKDPDPNVVIAGCMHTCFQSMKKVYSKFGAEHIVACFDYGSSWRKTLLYEDYKAHRRENLSKDQEEKLKHVQEALDDFYEFLLKETNVTTLREYGVEADDFIARWIQLHPNDKHIIISNDKDFIQLVDDNVEIYNGVKNELTTSHGVYYQDGVKASTKIKVVSMYNEMWKQKHDRVKGILQDDPIEINPKWELFLKIMKGDVSDNIPPAHIPRYQKKKMREAFENPNGPTWQSMMSGIKDKIVDEETGDETIITVKDVYEFNKKLVDMKMLPVSIIDKIDNRLAEELGRKPLGLQSVRFAQFCEKYQLKRLKVENQSYGNMLGKRY